VDGRSLIGSVYGCLWGRLAVSGRETLPWVDQSDSEYRRVGGASLPSNGIIEDIEPSFRRKADAASAEFNVYLGTWNPKMR